MIVVLAGDDHDSDDIVSDDVVIIVIIVAVVDDDIVLGGDHGGGGDGATGLPRVTPYRARRAEIALLLEPLIRVTIGAAIIRFKTRPNWKLICFFLAAVAFFL